MSFAGGFAIAGNQRSSKSTTAVRKYGPLIVLFDWHVPRGVSADPVQLNGGTEFAKSKARSRFLCVDPLALGEAVMEGAGWALEDRAT